MKFDNFYVLIDPQSKIVLDKIQELPENWKNIAGLPGLSDEELCDLKWAGWDNLGWLNIKSEKVKEYFSPEENLNLNKNTIKFLISEKIQTEKNNPIIIGNKNLLPDFETYFSLFLGKNKQKTNIKFGLTYYTFSKEECVKLCHKIENHWEYYSTQEMKIFEMIDNTKNFLELCEIDLNIF